MCVCVCGGGGLGGRCDILNVGGGVSVFLRV